VADRLVGYKKQINQMEEESLINKFELHYYFEESDDSHTMNAFVRNRCEFELLQIYNELQRELETDVKIETEAYGEGGLKELWTFLADNSAPISLLLIGLSIVLSRLPSPKTKLEKMDLQFSIEERKQNIANFKKGNDEEIKQNGISIENFNLIIDSNLKISKFRSNFYKQLENYSKVKKIAITKLTKNKQKVEDSIFVQRSDFDNFVLESDDLEPIVDENATIEIVSPVIKKGKYKWKGIYEKSPGVIDFYMKDQDFKQSVIAEGIEFKNGTFIVCVLEISRKINEIGEILNSSFSVLTVLKKHYRSTVVETPQGKKYRKTKEAKKNQFKLFENDEKEE